MNVLLVLNDRIMLKTKEVIIRETDLFYSINILELMVRQIPNNPLAADVSTWLIATSIAQVDWSPGILQN